jgi:hypothetical protein
MGRKGTVIREMLTYTEFTVGFVYMTTFENNTYSCNILIKTTKSSLLLFTFKKLEQ